MTANDFSVGFLQLYLLASLRRWRPKSLRFQSEQQRIEHWLEQVKDVAQSDYSFALELAECPEAGKRIRRYLRAGIAQLRAPDAGPPRLRQIDTAAVRLRNLREAALADDTGKTLRTRWQLNLLPRSEAVKIVCLGGGPAGLYFSILLKKANPSWDVTVIERNRAHRHVWLGHCLF